MSTTEFKMCVDCANKQPAPNLQQNMYFCPFVKDILPNGIIYGDTDATECIRNGFFKEILK